MSTTVCRWSSGKQFNFSVVNILPSCLKYSTLWQDLCNIKFLNKQGLMWEPRSKKTKATFRKQKCPTELRLPLFLDRQPWSATIPRSTSPRPTSSSWGRRKEGRHNSRTLREQEMIPQLRWWSELTTPDGTSSLYFPSSGYTRQVHSYIKRSTTLLSWFVWEKGKLWCSIIKEVSLNAAYTVVNRRKQCLPRKCPCWHEKGILALTYIHKYAVFKITTNEPWACALWWFTKIWTFDLAGKKASTISLPAFFRLFIDCP